MKGKFWITIALVLIGSILLSACAIEVPQVVEKEKIVEVVVTPTAAPPSAESLARAETLNIALGGRVADPTNLNIYAPGVSRSGTGIHQLIYEYFFYDNLQTGEYIPWLAEKYEYNEDFTSITVTLRQGVTWSDGQPFTADDVVFTYELLKNNPGMTWAAEANTWAKTVTKIDDTTVQIDLNKPNPRYHLIREAFPAVGIWGGLTILPKHIWEGQDPLTFKSAPPIGTGPYKLVSATQTALVYERRDDWWGTKVFNRTPGPKTINFQYIGDDTNVALALAANEIDTPFIGKLSLGSFQEVSRRNPNLRAWYKDAPYAWLDPCPRALMVQNATPPLDNKDVRWALSYMIDRQAIVALAYEGTTVPSWGIWPFYDGLQPYFDAIQDLRTQYPVDTTDLQKAEALLTGAGMTKAGDTWNKADGTPFEILYVVDADSTEEMKVSAVLADQLRAAGLTVNVQPMSGSPLADALLRGQYGIKLHSFCPGYIYDNLWLFHGANYVPLGEPAPWYERNSFRFQNAEFDAIVDEMGLTPPTDEAVKTQYHDAMAIWFDQLPVVPVVQAPALVPFNYTYWKGFPSADDPWNMPVSWWATFNLVVTGYQSPKTGEWVGGLQPVGIQ